MYKSISINQSLLKYPHTHAKCHTFKTTCKSALSFLFCTKYTAVSESCSCSVLSNSSVTPWTVAHQAPLSMGFSRQEYWRGLPFPFLGDLPNPGIKLTSPALPVDSLLLSHQGSLKLTLILHSSLYHFSFFFFFSFLVFSLWFWAWSCHCFVQWQMSRYDLTRNLQKVLVLFHSALSLCHRHEKR